MVIVLAAVGTCVGIFVLTVLLTMLLRKAGMPRFPNEPPLRKQFRTVGVICLLSAAGTAAVAFGRDYPVLYGVAGLLFALMMVLAVALSRNDARHEREVSSARPSRTSP